MASLAALLASSASLRLRSPARHRLLFTILTSLQQDPSLLVSSRGRSSHFTGGSDAGGRGDGGHARVEYVEISGSGAGRGGRGRRGRHGAGRGGLSSMDPTDALARCMTAILRHQAADYNLELKNDGYLLVEDLLKLSKKTAAGIPLSSHSEDDVRKAVAEDGKQRFGLKEENGKLYIRANQGHSIKTVESELLLRLITSHDQVPVCVHGTYEKFMSSIWKEGLKRMTRNHIHFATGLPKEDGVISGMRATAQVLIYLDVQKAMEDEMKLYISDNKVVLTEGFDGVVPSTYFKKVVRVLPHGREKPLHPPTQQPRQAPANTLAPAQSSEDQGKVTEETSKLKLLDQ